MQLATLYSIKTFPGEPIAKFLGAEVERTRGEGGHRVLQVCVRSDGGMAVNGQVFDTLARPVSRRDDISWQYCMAIWLYRYGTRGANK